LQSRLVKRIAKIAAVLGLTLGVFLLGGWVQHARDQPLIRRSAQVRTVERTVTVERRVPGARRTVTVKVPIRNVRCQLAVDEATSTLTRAASDLDFWLKKADEEARLNSWGDRSLGWNPEQFQAALHSVLGSLQTTQSQLHVADC
jgi:hypothetical protein